MKTLNKIFDFIAIHALELNCLVLIIISFYPIIFPDLCSGSKQAMSGCFIGFCASFYRMKDIGKSSLFKINSSIWLGVVLILGLIGVYFLFDHDPDIKMTTTQRIFVTYTAYTITYTAISKAKELAGKEKSKF